MLAERRVRGMQLFDDLESITHVALIKTIYGSLSPGSTTRARSMDCWH